TPAATTKAQKNSPVFSNTTPVSQGATTPARLPTKFCRPVHLPAASGPAMVCVIDQRLHVKMPKETQESIRNVIAVVWSEAMETPRMMVENVSPTPANPLRTRVVSAPPAIHRSDVQPQIVVVTPIAK